MSRILALISVVCALMLTGCAKTTPRDYTAFMQSKPRSILVLPPVNHSPDVNASHSLLSHVTRPLAEDGYYVLPVAVVEETFKQNGLTTAQDIRAVSVAKLHQIFGADAVLYIDVTDYGTKYRVILSETRVTAKARLVDLRTGQLLWTGGATASNNEQDNNNNSGLIGMLVTAALTQVANNLMDKGHDIAGITSTRLLSADVAGGVLYGPYSPDYGKNNLKI
ncbi:DUF799 domain-containing protein [Acerihabitans sp. TG2]|uniref:DUF799 domain-containing protein n=1 Tax=Acerihabitans sp. TG2 TaxID=3096008 RepID=UPI002B2290D6|nr:DUF799 domain-containing protein [Acerihabitans sp. TG2]MEA9391202.1 DUF799 domain-containing protein [Acerihabitans sp. TG2]